MKVKEELNQKEKMKNKRHHLLLLLNNNSSSYIGESFEEIHNLFLKVLPILSKNNDNKNKEEIDLIFDYILSLKNFSKIIKEYNSDKFKSLLFSICISLKYEFYESNSLIFKFGDYMNKFYIILEGKVDILIVKEKIYDIYYNDYIRYLGFLIGYGEFEMLKKVINNNANIFPLEIKDIPNEYGKIIKKKKKKEESYSKIISLNDIQEKLSSEELEKFLDNFKEISVKKSSLQINKIKNKEKNITSKDYINRLKNFKRKEKYINKKEEKIIRVKINEYYLKETLILGEIFGESNPFGEQMNLYDYTVISSSKCHLGIIRKDNINHDLKEAIDRVNKIKMSKILSSRLFNSIPKIIFSRKYLNYFLFEKKEKNNFLIQQNYPNDFVYILQEGIYEVTGLHSLNHITEYIKYLSKFIELKGNESLLLKIGQIIIQDKKLLSRCNEIKRLNKYYKVEKIPIKLITINFPDIVGLDECFYNENSNLSFFNWEIKSNEGNYYKIQRDFYKMIIDSGLVKTEKEILKEKSIFLIERLISIREIKLKYYFNKYPDYMFKEYISRYIKRNEYDFYNNKNNSYLKRRKSMSAIINKVKSINPEDYPEILEENSKRTFKISNKKEIFITKKYNSQDKNISLEKKKKKTLKINLKKNLNRSSSSTYINPTSKNYNKINFHNKMNLNINNNSERLFYLIMRDCPLTSITARRSLLETSKKDNSCEIFPYKEYKHSCYISARNKYNIQITRDIFRNFKIVTTKFLSKNLYK